MVEFDLLNDTRSFWQYVCEFVKIKIVPIIKIIDNKLMKVCYFEKD